MKLKIDFVDFWDDFDKYDNYFINTLKAMYGEDSIELTNTPDYLFFSCFGFKNLKYDCIKIFFTGENIAPDFNIADYAIGMHQIQFEDRYFRLPFYMLYPEACSASMEKVKRNEEYLNRKFCSYVISNSLGASERAEMIDLLGQYKDLDSGGKLNNNVGGPVRDKVKFISNYKFTLCFENSFARGYTTEKIVEGFAGGCIPIYWGNPDITKEFNPGRFINCNQFESMEEAAEYIKEIDQDNETYLSMLHQPLFLTGQDTFQIIQDNLEHFLDSVFINGRKRINDIYVGKKYTDRMRFFSGAFQVYRFFERAKGYIANRRNL